MQKRSLITKVGGLRWWSSGEDSTFPMQRVWVRFLVGELRSHMLSNVAKKPPKH